MTSNSRIKLFFGVAIVLLFVSLYYSAKPYSIEFAGHAEKLWAHRVNDVEKLQSALETYRGIELDIVYDSVNNELDVYHPPRPSAQLYLSAYLQEIPKNNQPFLWLDFKNLNASNSQSVLHILQENLDQADYPSSKVLIETPYYDVLPNFTAAGFSCSYYIVGDVSGMSKEELRQISMVLRQQPEIAISSNATNYTVLNQHFPKRNKYLWMINSFLKHGFGQSRVIITDPKVKGVLVRM